MLDVDTFLQIIFLLMPAGIGNTAPIYAAKIKGLNKLNAPLDCGYKYKGRRLLGDNKTWRGLLAGLVGGGLAGGLQIILIKYTDIFATVADSLIISSKSGEINWILLGMSLGVFAILGDAVKSLFKRRLGIKPGKSWPIFDQIDYILGAFIIVWLLFDFSWLAYLLGLLFYSLVHPVISYLGYLLKLKKDRF